MKKLLLALTILSSMSSFEALAIDVSCKTPHGVRPEQIRISKNDNKGYSVSFDNKAVVGFTCFDRSNSDFFNGLVKCTTLDGKLINVEAGDGSYPNGTLMLKGNKKIGLICFDLKEQ